MFSFPQPRLIVENEGRLVSLDSLSKWLAWLAPSHPLQIPPSSTLPYFSYTYTLQQKTRNNADIFQLLTQSGVVVQRWGSKKVGRGSKGVGTYKSTAPAACSKDKIHIKHMKKMKNTNIFTKLGESVHRWLLASSRCALMNDLCNHLYLTATHQRFH